MRRPPDHANAGPRRGLLWAPSLSLSAAAARERSLRSSTCRRSLARAAPHPSRRPRSLHRATPRTPALAAATTQRRLLSEPTFSACTGPPPPPPSRRRPSRRSETSCADTPTSSTSLRPPGCSDDAAACLALSPRPSLSLSLSLEKGISLPPSPSRSRSEYLSLRGAVSAHAGADRRAVGVPRQHLPDRRPGLSRLTRRACRRRGRGGTPSQAQHATHNQQKQRAPPPLHLQPASPRAPRVCLADVFIALPPPQTGLETLTLYIWDEDFKEWALPNSLEEVRSAS